MNLVKIPLADVKSAPWRFSEDHDLGHHSVRRYTPIQENIVRSLKTVGQLREIHVRPIGASVPQQYEILDGHIVVDAARQLGLKELYAAIHANLNDEAALEWYIHINLNRCGQYGHNHAKLRRRRGLSHSIVPGR
jgi:ParB-like chromosome segregation protein Spo0J